MCVPDDRGCVFMGNILISLWSVFLMLFRINNDLIGRQREGKEEESSSSDPTFQRRDSGGILHRRRRRWTTTNSGLFVCSCLGDQGLSVTAYCHMGMTPRLRQMSHGSWQVEAIVVLWIQVLGADNMAATMVILICNRFSSSKLIFQCVAPTINDQKKKILGCTPNNCGSACAQQ